MLNRIKWNSTRPPSPPPQIKDEATRTANRALFPSLILGGGGLDYAFIYSKIVASSTCSIVVIPSVLTVKAGNNVSPAITI